MARSRVGRFQRTNVSSRRPVAWSVGPRGILTAVSTNQVQAFGSTAVSTADNQTIVRTRGQLLLYLSAADAARTGFHEVAFGMCVVSQNAAGVGITAIPTPLTDIGWDGWFVHWMGTVVASSSTVDGSDRAAVVRVDIDSKAMRKIHATDNIVAVMEFASEIGVAVLEGDFDSRLLTKVP